jgi:hypothetical protein
LNQRGFAGLTGAIDHHCRGIRQGLVDGIFDISPNHGKIFTTSW